MLYGTIAHNGTVLKEAEENWGGGGGNVQLESKVTSQKAEESLPAFSLALLQRGCW